MLPFLESLEQWLFTLLLSGVLPPLFNLGPFKLYFRPDTEGEAMIQEGETSLECKKGDSVLLTSEADYKISTPSKVIIYKATVGQ